MTMAIIDQLAIHLVLHQSALAPACNHVALPVNQLLLRISGIMSAVGFELLSHAELENAWIPLDGKRFEVKLGRGPLIALERRNQVPAPIDA